MMTAQQRKSSDRLPRFPEPRQNILGWAPKKRGMCSNCASPHKEPVMDSLCHPCLLLLLPWVAGTDPKRDTGCRSNPCVNKPASTGSTSTTRHGSPAWDPRWGPRHHLGPFHASTTILVLTHFNSVTPQVAGRPGSQDSQKLFQSLRDCQKHLLTGAEGTHERKRQMLLYGESLLQSESAVPASSSHFYSCFYSWKRGLCWKQVFLCFVLLRWVFGTYSRTSI